jgi:hypothetical protein
MVDPTNPMPSNSRQSRETMILIVVALFGLGGLALLQFSRRGPVSRSEDRAVLQTGKETPMVDPNSVKPIQRIPGNLISVNEQPEAGRPFLFKMDNFAQGAVYKLDLGDGNRKAFVDGVLQHTYHRPGPFRVVLYAEYEGQSVALDSMTKIVAQTVKQDEIAPIIDY